MFSKLSHFLLQLEKNPRLSDFYIAGFVLGLIVTSVSATLIFVNLNEKPQDQDIPLTFSIYDAETICSRQMDERLGTSLLRYHLDTHSSRLDKQAGMYRLYLNADIGKLNDYSEVSVHCFISLTGKNLAHYRVHGLSEQLRWKTDLKFF